MATPTPSWNTVRVHGTWLNYDGTMKAGTYKVTMPVRVRNATDDVMIPSGVFTSGVLNTVAADGASLDLQVLSGNDPDNSPSGFTPILTVTFADGAASETFELDLPMSLVGDPDGLDLVDVILTTGMLSGATAALVRGVPGGVAGLNTDGDVIDADGNVVGGAPDLSGYATTTALTTGLAGKVDTTTYTTGLAAKVDTASTAPASKTAQLARRGINVAGAEFGTWTSPASAWGHETEASFAYLAGRGHRLIRYPIMWERIQPTLGGALDATEQANLVEAARRCSAHGMSLIFDVHNYAQYKGVYLAQAGGPTQAHFVDLWTRLSTVFKDNPAVVGYGLMNEPGGIPTTGGTIGRDIWQQFAQAALTAIRANDDSTCVIVAGYTASAMGSWFNATAGQPTHYIVDPIDNFRYEAHHYWDSGGGAYTNSYAQEDTNNAGFGSNGTVKFALSTLRSWLGWLEANNVKGLIGEFGWPRGDTGAHTADAPLWDALADQYLSIVESAGERVWHTLWATGSRWSAGYILDAYSATGTTLDTPLSQAAVLEKYQQKDKPALAPPVAMRFKDYAFGGSTPYKGSTYDPLLMAGGSAVVLGQPLACLIKLEEDGILTNLHLFCSTSVTTPTAGQCLAGIYDAQTGAQLAVSGDIGSSLTASAYRTLAMTTPTRWLNAGNKVYGVLLVNAATAPQFGRVSQVSGSLIARRFGLSGSTGQTTMPATISPGSLAAASQAFWMAVS